MPLTISSGNTPAPCLATPVASAPITLATSEATLSFLSVPRFSITIGSSFKLTVSLFPGIGSSFTLTLVLVISSLLTFRFLPGFSVFGVACFFFFGQLVQYFVEVVRQSFLLNRQLCVVELD